MTDFDPRKVLGEGSTPKFDSVKLGSGVVGKLTNSMLAMIGLLTVVAYGFRGEPLFLLCTLLAAVVVFIFYVLAALWFAARNPAAATLEGSDFVAYRKLEMASKSEGEIIEGTVNQSTQSLPRSGDGVKA